MTYPLRWLQPDEAADFWRIYESGQLVANQVTAEPDAAGVRQIDVAEGSYHMTAVNQAGESGPSNVIYLIEPSGSLMLLFGLALLLMRRWHG